MGEQKVDKEQLKKDFLKTIKELEKNEEVEKIIKDNKIEFKIKNIKYRLRKPDYLEQTEIEDARRKKYLGLLDDNTMMFRKQWIEKYKKKGIDIDKMERDIITIENKIDALLMRLATINEQRDVEKIEEEIVNLKDDQATLNIEKTDLLNYSIEDVLNTYVTSYYSYLVLEKLEIKEITEDKVIVNENKWVRVFKDYDEFVKCQNSELINKTFYLVNYLIYTLPF